MKPLAPEIFNRSVLAGGCEFWTGMLPPDLLLATERFEQLWAIHPEKYHAIMMHGRWVNTPRWQQAYGREYHYTGYVNKAMPVPPMLIPMLDWAKAKIDESLNGLLLNWYDGELGHYIGAHRDSTRNLLPDSPIVTISFGESRTFRIRPYGIDCANKFDFPTGHGSVFVMPSETNAAFTHEVLSSRRFRGRRISVTFRSFRAD